LLTAPRTTYGPPSAYEVESAFCRREGEEWIEGSSGNSTGGFTPATADTHTIGDEAPSTTVTAARFVYGEQQQIIPVTDGCALAVFDDVSQEDAHLAVPHLAAAVSCRSCERVEPWRKLQ